MLAKVLSSAVMGVDAYQVEVEVDIARGLPVFSIVGLPEASVRESRERVKSAIKNSGFTFPAERITVNLAPAHVRKEGTGFDLPIALGILAAGGVIPAEAVARHLVLGELSLGGRIRPVRGSLPMALFASRNGYDGIVVPGDNAPEAAVVREVAVLPAEDLAGAVGFFRGTDPLPRAEVDVAALFRGRRRHGVDYNEVVGQEYVKRALEVAAAGSHNLLLAGPPGAAKTMLARRLPTILPPLTFEEAIETTKVHSIAGTLRSRQAIVIERPFRAPHHTTSRAGLTGGGASPRPGEISLAHNGVLFLDEFPEFSKTVLEVLRQPVEDQRVTLSRAGNTITYPANFMLVAAMNPCPCGYSGGEDNRCTCTPAQVRKYRGTLSGPLLDRIDLQVEVPAVPHGAMAGEGRPESSAVIRRRVAAARRAQARRFKGTGIHGNAMMGSGAIRRLCEPRPEAARLLAAASENFNLSARAHGSILKVARTIADLAGKRRIGEAHLSEAIQYRGLDRPH